MRWTVHLDGGPTRVNHAAVAIGDRIYSFGGYCTGQDYEQVRPMDVHMLNTVSLRWTMLPLPLDLEELKQTPYQRYGHTAVEYEGNGYIWGGRNDRKGPCNKLYIFDGATRKWVMPKVNGKIPKARDGHSACVINHCMYLFAGYEEYTNRFTNDMNYIDLRTFTWVLIPTNGEPARWRDFHTATPVGDTMYVFGGRCDEGGDLYTSNEIYCNKLMAFNTKTHTWIEPHISSSDKTPVGRRSHSAFFYNGRLFIFGGYNGRLGIHLNDLHAFDLASMQWSELKVPGRGPFPCRRQCCCVIGSKVYLFGGTSPRYQEPSPQPLDDSHEESELMDRSDLFVLDFEPTLKTLASTVIIDNKLDCSYLPHDLRWDLSVMISNNRISRSNPDNSRQLVGVKPL